MSQSHSATGTVKAAGGCGCGGGSADRGCSCQKQDCQECQTTALVRPRFFAGQLLTEDDLESLTTYVVGKQRLHTRHLHGAGVVCGLEVTCNPCGGGTVTVHPGYALDCCGNDIAVSCASELDVLSMIRRLQLDTLGGYDCGDPCEGMSAEAKVRTKLEQRLDATLDTPAANGKNGTNGKKPQARRYCLYVRYCEEGTDPVTPYVLDEPCGDASSCEHTRVREGYRFELRCADGTEAPPTLMDRLKQCADPGELSKEIYSSQIRKARFDSLEYALSSFTEDQPIVVIDSDSGLFDTHETVIGDYMKQFGSAKAVEEEAPSSKPSERELRGALDAFVGLARVAAKARAAQASGAKLPQAVTARAEKARKTLEDAESVLRGQLSVFERAEDLLLSGAALDEGLKWTASGLESDVILSKASRLFIGGALQSRDLSNYDLQQLSQLKSWLQRRIAGGLQTDCRLRAEVEAIRIDPETARDETALVALRARLDAALQRYVAACFCMALLPPCPPCDDTAVLLACLTVENCEVVDICNLERTFVLSWPAMRYWMPWVGELGQLFEKMCCPGEVRKAAATPVLEETYAMAAPATAPAGWTSTSSRGLFSTSGDVIYSFAHREPLEGMLRFAAPGLTAVPAVESYTRMLDRAFVPLPGAPSASAEKAFVPQGDQLADALMTIAPRRTLDALIEERITELRPPRELKVITDTVDEQIAAVTLSLGEIKREIKKRPTAAELAAAKPVKRLAADTTEIKKANKRLEKANEELLERLDALAKRLEKVETR